MTFSKSAKTQPWVKAFLTCTLLFAAHSAMAAGGLGSAEAGLKDFFTSFYGIALILAMFGLLGCAIMGWMGMKHWGDLFPIMGWIAVGGATPSIVKMIWEWGKSAL